MGREEESQARSQQVWGSGGAVRATLGLPRDSSTLARLVVGLKPCLPRLYLPAPSPAASSRPHRR
jgi:hypothetical protein